MPFAFCLLPSAFATSPIGRAPTTKQEHRPSGLLHSRRLWSGLAGLRNATQGLQQAQTCTCTWRWPVLPLLLLLRGSSGSNDASGDRSLACRATGTVAAGPQQEPARVRMGRKPRVKGHPPAGMAVENRRGGGVRLGEGGVSASVEGGTSPIGEWQERANNASPSGSTAEKNRAGGGWGCCQGAHWAGGP